jgi:DNA-binding response OmpR family regulator
MDLFDDGEVDVTQRKGTILIFEDNEELSELLIDFLHDENYHVVHFFEFPDLGVESIESQLDPLPDAILMDIQLPKKNGYHICHILKENNLSEGIPVIFISEKMQEEDILKAYDCGADDYLTKPLRLKELSIKLNQYTNLKQQKKLQQEQMGFAQKMAFEAMTTSSELGEILRFHEQMYSINQLDELAGLVLNAIIKFSLKSSIIFFTNKTSFFSQDGSDHPLEEKVLKAFKGHDRIFSWKDKTFFNYEYFSVLIRNMPIDNEQRYGILKDQICLLLNGVDARVNGLMIEESNKKKAITMKIAADILADMVVEIERNNVELSKKFEAVILKMEDNLGADILQFNLLENEEKILMSHVLLAIKESSEVFEISLKKEKQHKDIMSSLLKDLMHGA